jgi:tRNA-binding EMAP/Myf-like protein
MPFDGNGFEHRIGALEKIDRVIDLLGHENRWCKQQLHTYDGRRCILGAVQHVGGTIELQRPILQAIEQVTGVRHARIEAFNDHPATSHALVLRVLYRTRENIVSGATESRSETRAVSRLPWTVPNPVAYLRGLFS